MELEAKVIEKKKDQIEFGDVDPSKLVLIRRSSYSSYWTYGYIIGTVPHVYDGTSTDTRVIVMTEDGICERKIEDINVCRKNPVYDLLIKLRKEYPNP